MLMMLSMTEIKKKNGTELLKLVAEKREALRKIRFESAGSGMRNTHAISNLRHEIARMLTELNSRTKIGG
jgi:ribosomal protein L29